MKMILLASITAAALLASGASQAITPTEWGLQQVIGCQDGEGNVFSRSGESIPKPPYTTTFACGAANGTLAIDSAGLLKIHAAGDQLPMTLGDPKEQRRLCADAGTELSSPWGGAPDDKETAISCRDADGSEIDVFLKFNPDDHSIDIEAQVPPFRWPLMFYKIRNAISDLFSAHEED